MKDLINDIGKKKILIIGGVFIGLIVFIIILLLVVHSMGNKSITYKGIETKLLTAAKGYYKKNPDLLPTTDGQEVSVDDVTLSAGEHMKPLSELTSKMEGVSCTGKVLVSYVRKNYRYTPILDCGDSYNTETLVSYINKNEPKVFQGQGLYDMNSELVYRGENPNNYIKFSDKVYRIVKIVDNKTLIIANERIDRGVWDNRYNVDRNREEGINDYSVSRIKTKVNQLLDEGKIVNEKDMSLLAIHDLYIGKRAVTDSYNDGTIEKSTVDNNQYVGLLPLYDYLNASIDTLCQSVATKNCSNYNYLRNYNYVWWLLTGDSSASNKAYKISGGKPESQRTNSNYYIRPVLMLSDSALYAGGKGTLEDPYLVK